TVCQRVSGIEYSAIGGRGDATGQLRHGDRRDEFVALDYLVSRTITDADVLHHGTAVLDRNHLPTAMNVASCALDLLGHAFRNTAKAKPRVHEAVHETFNLTVGALDCVAHRRPERQPLTALRDPVSGKITAVLAPDLL